MRTPQQGKGEVPLLYLVPGLYLWAIYTVGRLPLMLPLGQACGNMYNTGPDVEIWSTQYVQHRPRRGDLVHTCLCAMRSASAQVQ